MDKDNHAFFEHVAQRKVPEYAKVYFDGLYGEYRALEPGIEDEDFKARMRELNHKRWHPEEQAGELTWNDVYQFDLALLDIMPVKDLVRKAYDMRSKYRSIAGPRDYDAYIASKPPDLIPPPARILLEEDPIASPPDAPTLTVETLRSDIRYLLKQFYLYYALLPYREGLRDELTRRARNITFIMIGLILGLILLGYGVGKTPRSLVAIVIFAGIIGGCVSMLQRIQSAPSEGDPLYNVATLAHGWKGISLSPLYGGIFATLLFVLFASGILKGTIFPVIVTPCNYGVSSEAATPAPTPDAAATPVQGTEKAGSTTTNESASQTPCKKVDDISLTGFLKGTYPENGISYALLVIWSFIAGFAERLVPDTLNRLVAKNESIQGTSS
ncbi:MAG TPA: hypothetical protein VGB17_00075 [Pyrinomonadaceae bacterium]|jgi:uncharacterized membrane protein YraQ (UPF0718 family)